MYVPCMDYADHTSRSLLGVSDEEWGWRRAGPGLAKHSWNKTIKTGQSTAETIANQCNSLNPINLRPLYFLRCM